MPLIEHSAYKSPYLWPNGHIETLIPGIFRKTKGVMYERERIFTPDQDFLDLDWSKVGARKLIIVSHGLEGNSERAYVQAFVKFFNAEGWDALAWNCRSCSGEMNLTSKLYHHGASYDLDEVIKHAIATNVYDEILLVGVSMGGSLSLRWLGEQGENAHPSVIGATVFSVPCSLPDSVRAIEMRSNRIYEARFIKKLKKKVLQKAIKYPELVDVPLAIKAKNFRQLDKSYSINVYGFDNVDDFYEDISAYSYIAKIRRPTLIVNAVNDPMLIGDCFPVDIAKASAHVYLEMPQEGGHVGFKQKNSPYSWAEVRAWEFYQEVLGEG
ncbi:YheT family hydrolase [Peijinzhouia sedimentorum]